MRRVRVVDAAIFFAFCYAFVPPLLQVTLGARPVAQLGEVFTQIPISAAAQAILQALVVITTAAGIVRNALRRNLQVPDWYWLYLLPCVVVSIASYFADGTVGVSVIVYALVGLLVAGYEEPPKLVRLIGFLTVCVATVSIGMGLLAPSIALMSQAGVPDAKALIGETLLVGPTYHPNNLGQVLALGIPTVLAIKKHSRRIISLLVVGFALVWTGSRTGIIAGCLSLLVCWLWHAVVRKGAGVLRPVLSLIYLSVVPIGVAIVLVTTDPAAFSGRGYIWERSLEYAERSPLLGFGSQFYYDVSQSRESFGALAYHGHNIWVNTLLISGALGIFALLAVQAVMLVRSWRNGGAGLYMLCAWPISFICLGWLESPTNFYSFSYISWVAWPMIAFSLARANQHVAGRPVGATSDAYPFQSPQIG